jgi:hypothetical protein
LQEPIDVGEPPLDARDQEGGRGVPDREDAATSLQRVEEALDEALDELKDEQA